MISCFKVIVTTLAVSVAAALVAEASEIPATDPTQPLETVKQHSRKVSESDTALIAEASKIPDSVKRVSRNPNEVKAKPLAGGVSYFASVAKPRALGNRAQMELIEQYSGEFSNNTVAEPAQLVGLMEEQHFEAGVNTVPDQNSKESNEQDDSADSYNTVAENRAIGSIEEQQNPEAGALAVPAQNPTLELIEQYSNEDNGEVGASNVDALAQVTSVSSLSDVQPTDWAFQALQSLVERYGCIAGYPNGTYRGNRAMTRYEFAAGLSACLDRINEFIASASTNLVTKEDLAAIQQLQQQFTPELASLRGRVDALEATTAQIEANQFSTTTRLNGIVNFALTDVFSGEGDDETTLQSRARLTFDTSFTGRDLLVNRIAAGNGDVPNLAGGTFEVVQSPQWYGNFNNNFFQVTLYYLFPIGDKVLALLTPAGGLHADYSLPADFLFEDFDGGRTALSTFAQRNPIYRLGGGSGAAFLYNVSDSLAFSAGYYAGEAFIADSGNGLFNGTYTTLAQLAWRPTKRLTVSAAYHHGYFSTGQFGFGDNSPAFVVLGPYTGTGVVNNTLAQFPTVTNSYAAQATWRVSPKFAIGGWVGFSNVRAIGVGDGEIWTYALQLAFPDLGKEGSLGGIILGAEPYLAKLENVSRFSNDTPFHIEGFYKYQLTDNISITPGVIWLTAPNQNADNEDIVIGTIRTTFTF